MQRLCKECLGAIVMLVVWDAVVQATDHRMRPIVLTIARLALILISREVFYGPMT